MIHDLDEMWLLKELIGQRAPMRTIREQLGHPQNVVDEMIHALKASTPLRPSEPEPDEAEREWTPRPTNHAKHIRAVWQASRGKMFPFGVNRGIA